jgi:TolB-like protein
MASPDLENSEPSKALISWKEIAVFLNRAERTVKRWERERGLPVHRVPGGERGSVFAYPEELASWLRGEGQKLEAEEPELSDAVAQPEATVVAQNAQVEPTPVMAPVKRRWSLSLARVAAWVVPLALTGILIFYFWGGHTDSRVTAVGGDRAPVIAGAPDVTLDSVAVLPFANSDGNAGTDYLSDGITESLTGNLAHLPQIKVRSRDSAFRFKGKDIGVQEAGKKLGVSVVVSGRVAEKANKLVISAELTNVRDNTEIWGRQYTGNSSDLIQLQEQIAGDVAKILRSNLSPADQLRVASQGTQNTDAYNLYLKGRYAWYQRNPANLSAAISDFNQAIVKDPSYALAYSGLADAYAVSPNFGGNPDEDFSKSNAAARKALELDPTLARPHAVLGTNDVEYYWDFANGEAEFKKAIALDPNDATVHQWYAEKLGQLGRHQEALAEINRAHDLDPLSPVITRVMAGTLADAGRYDEAIDICKRLVQESPTLPMAHDCLHKAYWGKQMYPEAIEELVTTSRLNGTPEDAKLSEALEQGYRSGGWRNAFAAAAETLEARRKSSYSSAFEIARFYAAAGESEKAFHWLDIAYREHDELLLGLNVLPGFEKMRSDPRFSALVRKVGLPQVQ